MPSLEEIQQELKTRRIDLEDENRTAQRAYLDQQRARDAEAKSIEKALEALGSQYRRPGRPRKGERK